MTKLCRPDRHTWHIATCLVLGLPGPDQFYPVLLVRQCGVCHWSETWIGEQCLATTQLRLYSVET